MANKMTNPMKVITGPKTRWSYANEYIYGRKFKCVASRSGRNNGRMD